MAALKIYGPSLEYILMEYKGNSWGLFSVMSFSYVGREERVFRAWITISPVSILALGMNFSFFWFFFEEKQQFFGFFWHGGHFMTLKTHGEEFVWNIFESSIRTKCQKNINLRFRLGASVWLEPSSILKNLPAQKSKDHGCPPQRSLLKQSSFAQKTKREIIIFIKNVSIMVFLGFFYKRSSG